MDIATLIIDTAREKFGIAAIKPYQLLVCYRIIEQDRACAEITKKPQIVVLPTGTGKSLCFLLPALLCNGVTIIVYPLLALMNDQMGKLKGLGIPCVTLRGGQTKTERERIFTELSDGKARIVITNPETLCNQKILNRLKGLSISLFVCDEAHVISGWGESFRPAYRQLGSIIDTLNPMQTLAFTATASKDTMAFISDSLRMTDPVVVRGDADRENIHYSAFPSTSAMLGTMEILRRCRKPAIVFCRRRKDTENCAITCKRLMRQTKVLYYHAGLTKNERRTIEDVFLKSSNAILFCTSAYGMGVDKPDVRTVIHQRLPDDAQSYIQESGRAGRDGKPSTAWAVITIDELDKQHKPDSPLGIFTSSICRRTALLKALDQEKTECTGCDVCCGNVIAQPPELKTILRFVRSHPLQYSEKTAASILCGTNMEERTNPYHSVLSGMDEFLVAEGISNLTGSWLEVLKIRRKRLLYVSCGLQSCLRRILRHSRRSL